MALERSYLRKYAEKMKAPAAAPTGAPGTPEEEKNEPTLADIMRDDNVAFGEMLGSYKRESIMKLAMRVKDGSASEKDFDALVGYRQEFLDRRERAGKLIETLGFYSKDFKENSKAFGDLSKLFGDEAMNKTLEQGLNELVMKDPKAFEKIESYYKRLEVFEETVEKPMDDRINAFCEKHHLEQDSFITAMQEKDPTMRRKMIQSLILEQKSLFGKIGSLLVRPLGAGWGAYGAAHSMSMEKSSQDALVQQRETMLRDSGNYLKMLVTKNPEWREALLRAAKGEQPAFKKGFDTKMTFEESAKTIKPSDVQAGWAGWLNKKGYDFNNSDAAGQEAYRDDYLKEYAEKVTDKEGFWAKLLKFIFVEKTMKDPRIRGALTNI